MIQLIADSGSTKADWAVITDAGSNYCITTTGINPVHQDDATIDCILTHELLPQLTDRQITHIYFYGAGCSGGETTHTLQTILHRHFGNAVIEINSDLLGAARSLCGNEVGIVGILGTGANSCMYDGEKITRNIPPLGYILGDEGSGASLGKAFLRTLLRGELGTELIEEFYATFNTNYNKIIHRIYKEPTANRYLASLSPFIASHLHIQAVKQMVAETMESFMNNHIMQYDYRTHKLHLTGSIAAYYRDIISQTAQNRGIVLGNITRTPIEGLITFHLNRH